MPLLLLLPVLGFVAWWLMRTRTAIGYVNGQPIAVELADVGQGASLRVDAAAAFKDLQLAAATADVLVRPSGPRAGFRSDADQEALQVELGSYATGGLAAAPGHSPHQSGVAIDIDGVDPAKENYDAKRRAWLLQHGPDFGFFPIGDSFTHREPWHWEFRSNLIRRA